jgi:hypothetical protein
MKRLNYFDHQFLRAKDFNDEQSYHLSRRYLHNSVLHTAGIAQGLQVKKSETRPSAVTVESGIAIDRQGREIILNDDRTLDLLNLSAATPLYVFIEYKEQQTDETDETGTTGNTRWTEDPVVASVDNKNQLTQAQLVLARVSLSATGDLEISGEDRVAVGVSSDDLIARTIRLKKDGVSQGEWPKLSCSQANEAALTNSSLRLDPNREITFEGNGQLSSTGDFTFRAGSPTPTEKLRISANGNVNVGSTVNVGPVAFPPALGRINVSGATAGFSFVRRSLTAWPAQPAAGDRFLWYSPDGTARLWTDVKADLLAVTPSGNVGIGTTTPEAHLEISNPWSDWIFLRQQRATGGGGGFHIHNPWGDALGDDRNRLEIGYRSAAGVEKWELLAINGVTGYVGIGTGVPTHRLHVNDNLGIRQNRLYLSGGDGWSSLSYNAHHNKDNSGWVFPDQARDAVTIELDDTPAGGKPRLEVFSTTASARTKWVRRFSIDGATGVVTVDGNLTVSGDLTVNGKANIPGGTGLTGGDLQLDSNHEIFFKDNGQIRSLDNNHRILFRRSENKLEIREIGDLIFSPGATAGNETAKVVMAASGNVGIGTTTPGFPLSFASVLGDKIALWGGKLGNNYGFGIQSFLLQIYTDTPDADIALGSGSSGSFKETMRAKGNGNVGIGTVTAGARLTVQTGGTDASATAKGKALFVSAPMGEGKTMDGGIEFRHDNLTQGIGFGYNTIYATGSNANQDLTVQSKGAGGSVCLNPAQGNVGIGTAAPKAHLEISSSWSDWIFLRQQRATKGGGGFHIHNAWGDALGDDRNRLEIGYQTDTGVEKWELFAINGSTGNVGIRTGNPQQTLHVAGNALIQGTLLVTGGKNAYVMDQFVNNLEDTLEQGDVVVIGKNQASLYYGKDNNIPIPEVDLTQKAYDTRICGVVCEVHGQLKAESSESTSTKGKTTKQSKAAAKREPPAKLQTQEFTQDELAQMDHTKIEPGQSGYMVTLGAFSHCKVDADIAPIQVGDLLTTSPTKGHAQKVTDTSKAVGAIVGKALGSLKKGKGKIPIMVALQ